jgi:hypothetical protein
MIGKIKYTRYVSFERGTHQLADQKFF